MDILIDSNTIRMNEDTLSFIRENYPDNLMHFIEKNIAEYATIMSSKSFLLDEVLQVLELSGEDEHKLRLLEYANTPISVQNRDYSDKVKAYILENNFEKDDFSTIIEQYTNESAAIKAIIEKKVVDNLDEVLDGKITLPISLFDSLLLNTGMSHENKMNLFSLLAENLEKEQFRSFLAKLDLGDFIRLFERGQPLIQNTPVHEKLLETMKRKGWISSYKVDSKNRNFFRAYGLKSHKNQEA